jgi:outer membrane protein assembly factor BamB
LSLGPDGSERWRRGLDGRPGPILLDQNDTALFATSRGTLYAIDAAGELRWLLPADALRAGRPVLSSEGTVFIVFRGGLVAAYR